MEDKHNHQGAFLLCLVSVFQKLTIVIQWTLRFYQDEIVTKPLGYRGGGAGGGGGGTAVAAEPSSNDTNDDDNSSMMAQVLSHPAPIDMPDNKHKDDDLSCMTSKYFHIEENRLRSFAGWPVSFISPNVLARYGFYYMGTEDTVKCYFCRVEIGMWEPQDDVIQEHLRWSPYCCLLKKRPTNNVPINANYLDAVPEPSFDVCGGIIVRNNSYAENAYERPYPRPHGLDRMSGDSWNIMGGDISLSSSSGSSSGSSSSSSSSRNHGSSHHHHHHPHHPHSHLEEMVVAESVGPVGAGGSGLSSQSANNWPTTTSGGGGAEQPVGTLRRPEYPNYAIEADRLKSYEDWPTSLKQKPKQLSDAGFFYTGKSDRVKCFSCGGGLKDWEQDDEPWEQHAIWYSNCQYLQLMKGPEFIQQCLALKDAAAAAEPTANGVASCSGATATSSCFSSTSSQPSTSGISSASSSIMSTSPASSRSALSSPSPVMERDESPRGGSMGRCGSSSGEEGGSGDDDTGSQKLSDGKICRICFVNEYNTAFMPCGHVVACAKCASSVTKCPLCQQPFINVLRLYLS